MVEIVRYIPRCVTAEDYRAWEKMLPHPQGGFCGDCLPEFKAKMIVAGRCDNPDTNKITRNLLP